MTNLRLDWCTFDAAKYAVLHWHYSERMPAGRNLHIGVWEDGEFIGAVLFGLGSGRSTDGRRYGLAPSHEMVELTRIALRAHKSPVSRIVAIAIKMLKRQSPGVRLITSMADPRQGHTGGIYRAGGWVFTGMTADANFYRVNGKEVHRRTIGALGVSQTLDAVRAALDPKAEQVHMPGKYRYLMPLDEEMRRRIAPLAQPYPSASRLESEAPGVQPGDEGAAMRPTRSTTSAAA